MQKYLDCALEASKIAEKIIQQHYHDNDFSIQIKEDNTPVTEVDVAVEKAIYNHISTAFPSHGFYGEEEGHRESDSDFIWLVDPIDGTKAFVRKRPFFSCQIALMYKGEIVLGVSCAPAYNGGERAYALKGKGAYLNDQKITVSDITQLSDVVLSSGNLKTLALDIQKWAKYGALITQVNSTRGFGDFLHYHFLAAGRLDLIVESDVNILDVAALAIIVTEAGGKVTTLEGEPLGLASTSILAANPKLHQKVLPLLN